VSLSLTHFKLAKCNFPAVAAADAGPEAAPEGILEGVAIVETDGRGRPCANDEDIEDAIVKPVSSASCMFQ
jgi:hypothetical protein